MDEIPHEEQVLILAAEECPPDRFDDLHRFQKSDNRIISKLISHGPVLLRGGRGTGKSAYLIKSYNYIKAEMSSGVFGIYLSLRYLPLLRAEGAEYDVHFCKLLSKKIQDEITSQNLGRMFSETDNVGDLQRNLNLLSTELGKRIVILLDDAAHIGRESSQSEFFDIFRAISTSNISIKASIYPGVTKFGVRFDVFNDATVIDIARDERSNEFVASFVSILEARYPEHIRKISRSRTVGVDRFCAILGRAMAGNLRAFIFACENFETAASVGYPELTEALLSNAVNYYWPLMEEIAPKLGYYEPLIGPAEEWAKYLFEHAALSDTPYVLVHREIVQKWAKALEILEYAGFLSKRDASKALKSGGRGSVYALNLCNLLDATPGRRLTVELTDKWLGTKDAAEVHLSNPIVSRINMPDLNEDVELRILDVEIEKLRKSRAYPYGLTEDKIQRLQSLGIKTIGELADTSDIDILKLEFVGPKTLQRIRDVQYQAIWM